jgi:hypothetical protein
MRRRDVAIAIVTGLLLVLMAVGISIYSLVVLSPILVVLGGAIELWYFGAGLVVASVLLNRRPELRDVSRLVGFVGVAWISFVVGFAFALSLIFVLASGAGP